MRRLFISFSGGETSALMTRLLLTRWLDLYDERVVVFANTGQENEQTLEFVQRCNDAFGFGVVWVEAEVRHFERASSGHRVVDFKTASRNGEPFEDVIRKYGIPNKNMPHCTRELKQRPMRSYLLSLGWEPGTYDTAIGIRADEGTRRSPAQAANRMVYPLLDWLPTSKPQINQFWMGQPFRLQLTGYQGNCRWCWKKSLRKHMTIMDESPEAFDFPERMEESYGLIGAEFKKEVRPGYKRVFFRQNMSTKDLRALHAANRDRLERAEDDSIVLPNGDLFQLDLEPDGCIESCEVTFEEAA